MRQDSLFSRSGNVPERHRFGHLWQKISLTIGEPLAPESVTVEQVEKSIVALLASAKSRAEPSAQA